MLHKFKDLETLPEGPKLIVATQVCMNIGYSRELFTKWAEEDNNLVLLVQRGERDSLADKLYQTWESIPVPFAEATSFLRSPNSTISLKVMGFYETDL